MNVDDDRLDGWPDDPDFEDRLRAIWAEILTKGPTPPDGSAGDG